MGCYHHFFLVKVMFTPVWSIKAASKFDLDSQLHIIHSPYLPIICWCLELFKIASDDIIVSCISIVYF